MKELKTERLGPAVAKPASLFFSSIMESPASASLHSIHIVGSAATEHFRPGVSDINSIVVLNRMDHDIVRHIAKLGKSFAKKSIAAPTLISAAEINTSVDTFPVEFLNFKLMHTTILGDDVIEPVKIEKKYLRLQCERETKLLHLNLCRQYISTFGRNREIPRIISFAVKNSIPLFRAIIYLMGVSPSISRHEVISEFIKCSGIESGIVEAALQIKEGVLKPSGQELESIFFHYCSAIEKTSRLINDLHVQ
ncbi:MAG: hypothetical protein LLF86_03570 [Nitrospiraceae bacterium]|nr:hypothetical protein [Nitrospiraceae bacterium]